MKYQSTRGGVSGLSFEEALFNGIAEDGGLVVPEEIPLISLATLESWKNLTYVNTVKKVLKFFIPPEEISEEELNEILDKSFATFDTKEVVKRCKLGDLTVFELWRGRSLAFKDLAMTCVTNLSEYFLKKKNKHITSIIMTSGDTGSSAILAVKGMENIDVVVLFPNKGLSEIQEKMMSTVKADNVHCYAVECTNDDLDLLAIEIFSDSPFCKRHNLSSLNSVNWARICVQIAHHIFIYLQTCTEVGARVDVLTPTGGGGNIASGWFARAMGVPINFICSVNKNNLFERVIRDNDFTRSTIENSLAPAMDIQLPLNIERLIWISSNRNCDVTKEIMSNFQTNGKATIPDEIHKKLCDGMKSQSVTDEEIIKAMKKTYEDYQYLSCPHTCTALAVHYGFTKNVIGMDDKVPRACISTASPAKFKEAFDLAGISLPLPKSITEVLHKDSKAVQLSVKDNWVEAIKDKIVKITNKWTTKNTV